MSNSHRLGVIATRNIFSYLLSLGPNFDPLPQAHPYPGAIFFKIESLHPCVQGEPPVENEVDRCNRFCAMLLTDTRTDGPTDGRTHKVIAINPWRGLIS